MAMSVVEIGLDHAGTCDALATLEIGPRMVLRDDKWLLLAAGFAMPINIEIAATFESKAHARKSSIRKEVKHTQDGTQSLWLRCGLGSARHQPLCHQVDILHDDHEDSFRIRERKFASNGRQCTLREAALHYRR